MTRSELLYLLVGRARTNGFEFRRWYTVRLGLPWISAEAAVALLEKQRRYYALIFSHEFAQSFWKAGADITFDVPGQNFRRVMPDGAIRTVSRKAYIRRSARPNAWRYHLREMALAEDPLRYLRKYLHIEDDLGLEEGLRSTDPDAPLSLMNSTEKTASTQVQAKLSRPPTKPLPTELPAFLQRPYAPRSSLKL